MIRVFVCMLLIVFVTVVCIAKFLIVRACWVFVYLCYSDVVMLTLCF